MIWIVECPRIICNVLGFMPLSMHLVANVCGDNDSNCGSFEAELNQPEIEMSDLKGIATV